jgi:hypothetical protein
MGGGQFNFGVVAAALVVAVSGVSPAIADERRQQLESLGQQYAGVELNSAQKQIKRRMVVWYEHNCRISRSKRINTGLSHMEDAHERRASEARTRNYAAGA